MKIIFINRFFYPDHSATSQMLSDLAFALTERGWSVHVIASRQRYDNANAELAALEDVRGVVVHRVWTSRFGRVGLVGRTVDYLSFYPGAALQLARLARCGDIVVAKTDPPLLSVMAAPVVWLKRARLINWLQDLFPEVAGVFGIGRGRLASPAMKLLKITRNHSLRSGAANIVPGELMARRLRSEGVLEKCIHIIPNWANGNQIRPVAPEDNPLRREWGMSGCFVVGYSGNLGRVHEFDTILEAMKLLLAREKQADIRFLFIGGGAQQQRLKMAVRENGLTRVQFRSYQPREHLAQSLSVADVHLISLKPEFEGLIVPSKFYGIAAAGRPCAYIGDPDGEIPRILKEADCGFTVKPGQGGKLARQLLALAQNPDLGQAMGARARSLFESRYDLQLALDKWEVLLNDLK